MVGEIGKNMNAIFKWLLPLLVVLAAGFYWVWDERTNLIATMVVSQLLESMDANDDGVLSEDEGFEGMFSLLDANGDGIAEHSELLTFIVRTTQPFRWSNPPEDPSQVHPGLSHETFYSERLDEDVGYNIYLPSDYASATASSKRYPVIYYLHGGRPGNESLSIDLVDHVHEAVQSGSVSPLIFVWVNGGEVSHYNYAQSPGEDVFIKELIPHIDATYRTIAARDGRALQGFSQGGRGVTRIMFKYPELFVSAAPGGAGYAVEKQIQTNGGVEVDTRQGADAAALDFGAGNDAYSLAELYANNSNEQTLHIMIWGGERGFNYAAILEYVDYLDGLGVQTDRLFAPTVDHNPFLFYEARGVELLRFHDRHWVS